MFHKKHFLVCLFIQLFLFTSFVMAEESKIKSALKPYIDNGSLPGYTALVGNTKGVLAFEADGVRDIKTKEPMTKDSVFWIASMSKPIAGAALMILVDEGKVKLDDPIAKYLPEFLNCFVLEKDKSGKLILAKPNKMPTVRQTMSHTAGFPFLTPILSRFGIDSISLQMGAFYAATTPLLHQPGTTYQYSNVGINTGAAIVERVSGKPYEVFLKEKIFDPLGMKDTDFFINENIKKRLVKSYTWDKQNKILKEINVHFLGNVFNPKAIRFPEAGGGLFSTAEDYFKFYQMLAGNGKAGGKQILSVNAVNEMTKDQTGLGKSYGIAIAVQKNGFSHGGAYATQCEYNRTSGKIKVFMVQLSGVPNSGKFHQAFLKASEQ